MTKMTNAPSMESRSAWLEIHPRLGMSLMDHLWNRLDGAYPNRWRAAFANHQAVENWREAWAEAFAEDGIRPEEIRPAIAACRRVYDWPPSLAEFLKVCRPQADPRIEWAEAIESMRVRLRGIGGDEWSRPQVYWAAVAIGWHDLNSQSWESIKARWINALAHARSDPVPPFMVALPAPGQQSISAEDARKRIAHLAEMLASKMTVEAP
jgi:hypothetical protein